MPQFEAVKDREMPEKALLNRYTQRDLVKTMQRKCAAHNAEGATLQRDGQCSRRYRVLKRKGMLSFEVVENLSSRVFLNTPMGH